MSELPLDARFIDGPSGRLFVLLRKNPVSDRCVLIVPPFAEEMNRCRPQIAATSRRLVTAGYNVVLPDLYGTGDSEGEFEDASWEGWAGDLDAVVSWIESEGLALHGVVAVRLGCALATEWFGRRPSAVRRAVFWQPVVHGEAYLKQVLRVRVAAAMAKDERETVAGLLERLEHGEAQEVAGYALSPSLAAAIRAVDVETYRRPPLEALCILQLSRATPARAESPAALIAGAAEGPRTSISVVELTGELYWASAESAVNPALCERTAEWFRKAADER